MCFHNRSSRCVDASHIHNVREEVKRDLENYHECGNKFYTKIYDSRFTQKMHNQGKFFIIKECIKI